MVVWLSHRNACGFWGQEEGRTEKMVQIGKKPGPQPPRVRHISPEKAVWRRVAGGTESDPCGI